MPAKIIDLRIDTVPRPTPEMRLAIANAEVGDGVIDKDPTVERLQERTAELLGKEASIFMPSGTMTNQVVVRVHCGPGDELICEEGCHIHNNEQAGYAQLSGVAAWVVKGKFGVLNIERLAKDHDNERTFAAIVLESNGLTLEPETIDTNIDIFRLGREPGTASELADKLRERGVLVLPFGPQQIRAVTHLDVSAADLARAGEVLREVSASHRN